MSIFGSWFLGVPVGVLLMLAGFGKFTDPGSTIVVLELVGVGIEMSSILMAIVPPIEFAVGMALVLGWRSTVLYMASLALLASFTTFLVVLAMTDYTASCACFGPLVDRWTQGGTFVAITRNLALVLLLAYPLWMTMKEKYDREASL